MWIIWRWIEVSRVYLLVFTAPCALLWMGSSHSGGPAMVLAHSALVLLYVLGLDGAMLRAGRDPRIALIPDRFRWSGFGLEALRAGVAVLLAISTVILIFSEVILALYAAGGAAAVLLMNREPRSREGRLMFTLAELWWSIGGLILPGLLIGARGWSEHAAGASADPGLVMSASAMGATVLGALGLGAFVSLCLLRDESRDRSDGFLTTATVLGRAGAMVSTILWLLGASTVAAAGVFHGWWGWGVAAATSWAAIITSVLLGAGLHQRAVIIWLVGHAASAAFVLLAR